MEGSGAPHPKKKRPLGVSRAIAWLVASAVALSACGGAAEAPAEDPLAKEAPAATEQGESPSPEPSPEPSPTTTTIDGQEVAPEEVEAIGAAVLDYFHAVADGNFKNARRGSVGVLADLATWGAEGLTAPTESAALMPATVNVDALEIVRYAGDEATVELEGRVSETYFDARSTESQLVTTDIGGPVSLIRRGGGWRVADHRRDGRAVTEQVRRLKGSQTSSGLKVEPLALDVRKKGAVLVVKLRNPSGLELFGEKARIILGSGKEIRTNYPPDYAHFVLPDHEKATVGIYFPKGHSIKGKTFRFAIEFLIGCDPVCAAAPTFDIPVRVSG